MLMIKSMDVTRYVKILARESSEIDDTVLQKVFERYIKEKLKWVQIHEQIEK